MNYWIWGYIFLNHERHKIKLKKKQTQQRQWNSVWTIWSKVVQCGSELEGHQGLKKYIVHLRVTIAAHQMSHYSIAVVWKNNWGSTTGKNTLYNTGSNSVTDKKDCLLHFLHQARVSLTVVASWWARSH